MLRKHDTGIQGRGMMNEVARSVLTSHELATFTYYIDQYEHRSLTVDDLTTALLDLLDTAEKVHGHLLDRVCSIGQYKSNLYMTSILSIFSLCIAAADR